MNALARTVTDLAAALTGFTAEARKPSPRQAYADWCSRHDSGLITGRVFATDSPRLETMADRHRWQVSTSDGGLEAFEDRADAEAFYETHRERTQA